MQDELRLPPLFQLLTGYPELLQRIASSCDEEVCPFDAGVFKAPLRAVNRAVRVAVNLTVSTVKLALLPESFPEGDLGDVYTRAHHVIIDAAPAAPEYPFSDKIFSSFVSEVLARCPRLVQNATKLSLSKITRDAPVIFNFLHDVVARLPNLQELHLENIATFRGRGTTPEHRRASFAQQLAAFLASDPSNPLAPASWPTLSTLISLDFDLAASENMATLVHHTSLASLTAALQTPSLQTLSAWLDPTTHSLLSTISHLRSLTSLELSCLDGYEQDFRPALLHALPLLTQLKDFCLLFEDQLHEPVVHPAVRLPRAWSRLTNLTRLIMRSDDYCYRPTGELGVVDLASVLCLPQLKILSVMYPPEACLSTLYPLTNLTHLYGFSKGGRDTQADTSAAITPEQDNPPPEWRAHLSALSWCDLRASGGSMTLHALQQLTSLRKLDLTRPTVTPELCRVLGELPLLTHLVLDDDSTPNIPQYEDAAGPRSLLPSIQTVTVWCTRSDYRALHLLARWTDLPTRERFEDLTVEIQNHTHAPFITRGWGKGWVEHAFADEPDLCCILADDDDVQQYLDRVVAGIPAHSAYHSKANSKVVLGQGVTPEGFGRLLRQGSLSDPAWSVCITDVPEPPAPPPEIVEQMGWQGPLALQPQLFQSLLPGGPVEALKNVSLQFAHPMFDDDCVAALVQLAPRLQEVTLCGPGLSGGALLALVLGCPQLQCVVLTGQRVGAGVVGLVVQQCPRSLMSVTLRSVILMDDQLAPHLQPAQVGRVEAAGWRVTQSNVELSLSRPPAPAAQQQLDA